MDKNLLSIEKRSSVNGTFWKKRFINNHENSNEKSDTQLYAILEIILYGRNIKTN